MFSLGMQLDSKYPSIRQYVVLFVLNLLNLADRYVSSSVKQLIINDLNLSALQASLPRDGCCLHDFCRHFWMLSDKNFADRRLILFGAVLFW